MASAAGQGPGFESRIVDRARRAADRGRSVSHGEREDGVSAVAAPVTEETGRIVAAVSLGGPSNRLAPERVEAFLPVLTTVAERLSELRFIGTDT
ncbi:IclR family transcriptional regulator C-terminal domain-containing protein [Streptomyces sp. FXJ1.4098]|nr:IclR family transcriptional regulator C-terminal domain-containing protein [Streptomyces sp. FXJ1.4098]